MYVAESEECVHSDAWQQWVDRTGTIYREKKIVGEEKREEEKTRESVRENVGEERRGEERREEERREGWKKVCKNERGEEM